ncbi:MAG: class B sortase [Oscillospiraceae bacterium]|nr:class B sortase [Oscillospiraceae bacterium]
MDKKKVDWRKIAYLAAIAILVIVIIVCVTVIGYKLITDEMDKQDYDKLEQMKESAGANVTRPTTSDRVTEPKPDVTDPSQEETVPTEPGEPQILEHLQVIYDINNDMVGWIEIPGTDISYPVVQTPDSPNFYLRKDFTNKKYATCGTIYVREDCDVWAPSDNLTIYGHNMSNGTMFADLHGYEDKAFWEGHKEIYFDTLYEFHTYEIFAVFISSAKLDEGAFPYHLFDDAEDAEEFDRFVANCKELSLYDTGITPQYGDKLITLSTCDKSIEEGRFVVVARRVI